MRKLYLGLALVLSPASARASLTLDNVSYRLQVIRSSDSWKLDPGLGKRLADIYAGLAGPAALPEKAVPEGHSIQLQLIGYLTATIMIERIELDADASPGASLSARKAAITVTGRVAGEEASRAQLVLIGDAIVGSIQLEGGETYLLDSPTSGRYVVEELKAAWKVSAQADGE